MRSSRTERKTEHHVSEELQGQSPMLSRKLRHSKQKRISYNSLVKLGLVVFGALFIGLFVLEMVKSRNVPEANFIEKEISATTTVQVKPVVAKESVGSQPSTATETKGPETNASPVGANQPATGQATTKANPESTQPTPQTAAQPTEKKPEQPASETKAASPQPSQPASSQAAQPAANTQVQVVRHVVKQGDTLFKLSRQYYGNSRGVDTIAKYNGIAKDGQLLTGTVLSIPLPKK
ncbi:LysM peptidoglycan-binding domain-containing protein [Brevibacillus migulae]|uniref:LysM peptidoglycan-binding domain-containing protein n=1 Tax=Brevibacillus migulae TaxID=1644114 RepID=UPI00106E3EDE|nr:LysM domain-containing protein [Brevibacillus migulae]